MKNKLILLKFNKSLIDLYYCCAIWMVKHMRMVIRTTTDINDKDLV